MKKFSLNQVEIDVDRNEPFEIEAEGHGATGFSWELKSQDGVKIYMKNFKANSESFGAGGIETFQLQVKDDVTELVFVLKAPGKRK